LFDPWEFSTGSGQWSNETWTSLYFRHCPLGNEYPGFRS
jgi:hypothetical protein